MKTGYFHDLPVDAGPQGHGTTAEAPPEIETVKATEEAAEGDLARQLGDFTIYRYYLSAAGHRSAVLMLIYAALSTIASIFLHTG